MEINENNVREFCNVIDCNQGENGERGGGGGGGGRWWVGGGEAGREGGRERGSLHTNCQCLGES